MKPVMAEPATNQRATHTVAHDSERDARSSDQTAINGPASRSERMVESRIRREATRSSAQQLSHTWVATSVLSLITSTGLSWFAEHSLAMNSWLAMGLGVITGFTCYMVFLPWHAIRQMANDRGVLRDLTHRLDRIDLENRRDPIGSVILQRDDEFGALSEAIHDCLGKAIAHRARANMLHRTMHDQIERRTRNATAKLQRESQSDALTGVSNRRALDTIRTRLDQEKAECSATAARRVTALVIDVDYFKQVNDVLGHEAGDEVIIFLAELLRSTVRRSDAVVRMGGDEFLILIYDDVQNNAEQLAERIRSLFLQFPWPHKDAPRPTLTIGIAEVLLGQEDDPLAEAIRRADTSLYAAKRAGRDRVHVYSKAAA